MQDFDQIFSNVSGGGATPEPPRREGYLYLTFLRPSLCFLTYNISTLRRYCYSSAIYYTVVQQLTRCPVTPSVARSLFDS